MRGHLLRAALLVAGRNDRASRSPGCGDRQEPGRVPLRARALEPLLPAAFLLLEAVADFAEALELLLPAVWVLRLRGVAFFRAGFLAAFRLDFLTARFGAALTTSSVPAAAVVGGGLPAGLASRGSCWAAPP
jgi:hypothetical protein